jgi:hypothetical protein
MLGVSSLVAGSTVVQDPPVLIWNQSPHHASTAAEAYLRGHADLLRAHGEWLYLAARAAKTAQEAYRKAIDNHKYRVLTRFELQESNRAHRKAMRGPALTMAEARAWARESATKPLSETQLDRATGAIAWPYLLRETQYDNYRLQLEELLARRAAGWESVSRYGPEIRQIAKTFLAAVSAEARKGTYSRDTRGLAEALKFLQALAKEATV